MGVMEARSDAGSGVLVRDWGKMGSRSNVLGACMQAQHDKMSFHVLMKEHAHLTLPNS